MTDLYSGDTICILSTLDFICDLATKHHAPPITTFDQPLYWEAAEIITDAPEGSHLKNIVLMLGCWHTFMNLIGAIGTFNLTDGTGLTDISEVVYGQNAVHYMMTGKSVQKAFHGHLLGWTDVSITALYQVYLRIIQSLSCQWTKQGRCTHP